MAGNLPWNGFVEDDSLNFAKAAIELYVNKKVWVESQNKGVRIRCFLSPLFNLNNEDVEKCRVLKKVDRIIWGY